MKDATTSENPQRLRSASTVATPPLVEENAECDAETAREILETVTARMIATPDGRERLAQNYVQLKIFPEIEGARHALLMMSKVIGPDGKLPSGVLDILRLNQEKGEADRALRLRTYGLHNQVYQLERLEDERKAATQRLAQIRQKLSSASAVLFLARESAEGTAFAVGGYNVEAEAKKFLDVLALEHYEAKIREAIPVYERQLAAIEEKLAAQKVSPLA